MKQINESVGDSTVYPKENVHVVSCMHTFYIKYIPLVYEINIIFIKIHVALKNMSADKVLLQEWYHPFD